MRYLVWWCLQWMEKSASIITTRPENSKAWQRRAKKTCGEEQWCQVLWMVARISLNGHFWIGQGSSSGRDPFRQIEFEKKIRQIAFQRKKGDSTFTIHLISGSSGGGVKLTARHFIQSHSHTLISYIRILIVPSPRSNECKCSRGRASVCELKSEWDGVCVGGCACVWVWAHNEEARRNIERIEQETNFLFEKEREKGKERKEGCEPFQNRFLLTRTLVRHQTSKTEQTWTNDWQRKENAQKWFFSHESRKAWSNLKYPRPQSFKRVTSICIYEVVSTGHF